ncbi:PorP/SprF family type IX secretion system membrane protein [Chondrinema litorale]|uniref:PorP/SprF family type IX secretion system membrane protein n=1 Tax=Chondrinema litorale TaxID=2994555 RepID=UPI002542E38E|nr:type IX secretion system membrane protein PorP/SprF [Chondrinema litorale]UZR98278.1 type IX secretion system membrane protein PorP/SprF [Chondrinema litorale]
MLSYIDRYIGIILISFCFCAQVKAQQQQMYSHYTANGLAINPAYTGSRDAVSGVLSYRNQWSQIDGAPVTQTLGVHAPVWHKKIGLGLNIVNDVIGISKNFSLMSTYSYRLKLKSGYLRFGVQAGVVNYRNNWSEVITTDEVDAAFSGGDESFWKPNFGAGLYFNNQKFFAGLSVPVLIPHQLNDNNPVNGAKLYQHYFFTAGTLLGLSPKLQLKPSFLIKYVEGAPVQADLNAMFIFNKAFWFGGSYRTKDGVVFTMQYHTKKMLWIGYAYDYPLTDLNLVTKGSHEIFIGIDYQKLKSKILSPRYF